MQVDGVRTGRGCAKDIIIELIVHLSLPFLYDQNLPLLLQGPDVVPPTSRVRMSVKEAHGSVPFLQLQNHGLLSCDGALEGRQVEALLLS
jgi:hypothetical protein